MSAGLPCADRYTRIILKHMDDQKQQMQMCAEDPTPDQCFMDIAALTKVFFTQIFQCSQNCDDPQLNLLRNTFAVPMMNMTIERLTSAHKAMAGAAGVKQTTAPIPLNYVKLMFDINNGMKQEPDCFREQLKRAQSEMVNKYQTC